jgi:hypothetical protein
LPGCTRIPISYRTVVSLSDSSLLCRGVSLCHDTPDTQERSAAEGVEGRADAPLVSPSHP